MESFPLPAKVIQRALDLDVSEIVLSVDPIEERKAMSTNVTETLQFNCTTCPSECLLTVEVERDADGAVVEARSVTGNSCPRGNTFAHQELTCPCACSPPPLPYPARRGPAARAHGRSHPAGAPRPGHGLIRGLVIEAPIRMGDVVLEDLLNTGIDLIASMDIDQPKQLI